MIFFMKSRFKFSTYSCLFFTIGLIFLFYTANTFSQPNLKPDYLAWVKALAAVKEAKPDTAAHYFAEAIRLKPGKSEYLSSYASFLADSDSVDKAIEYYLIAIQRGDKTAGLQLAKCYGSKRQTEKVLEYLEQYLKLPNKLPAAQIRFNSHFTYLENSSEWIDFWKTEWYKGHEQLLSDMAFTARTSPPTQALNELNKTINKNPKMGGLFALRGQVYKKINQPDAAISDYKKALERTSSTTYLLELARLQLENGQTSEAIKNYQKIIDKQPEIFEAWLPYIGLLIDAKQHSKAQDYLNWYLAFFPNEAEAKYMQARINFAMGNYTSVLLDLAKPIEYNPNQTHYRELRVQAYEKMQLWQTATSDYNVLINLTPENAVYWLNRGKCYHAINNSAKACLNWKRAGELGNKEAVYLFLNNCKQ